MRALIVLLSVMLAAPALAQQRAPQPRPEATQQREPAEAARPFICDPMNLIPGCANPPGTAATGGIDLQQLWQKIVGAAIPDLEYANALALTPSAPCAPAVAPATAPVCPPPTPGGLIRSQCWTAIINANKQSAGAGLKNPDGTPMVAPAAPANVFTSVEQLAEVMDNLSPNGPLFSGCAAAAQAAKMNVLNFIGLAVGGAAGFAALGVT